MNFLRILNPLLYDLIQPYRVTSDGLMPWAYQTDNPNGRPLHNDWGIMSDNQILKFIQPYQKVKRIDCAYRIPLPFKIVKGNNSPQWRLWDISYPTSPGLRIENRNIDTAGGRFNLPHALTDESGEGWSEWAAYINGSWINCFKQYRKTIGSKRIAYYNGLKQDLTVSFDKNWNLKSDLMAWFPEVSISYI